MKIPLVMSAEISVMNNVEVGSDHVVAKSMIGGPLEISVPVKLAGKPPVVVNVELNRMQIVEFMARTSPLATFQAEWPHRHEPPVKDSP